MGCMPLSMARSPQPSEEQAVATVHAALDAGITRGEGETWGRDGSKAYLRKALEASLRALEVDVIDLYQWHRPDRWKVYGEVVQHFADFQAEGLVKAVGISNANVFLPWSPLGGTSGGATEVGEKFAAFGDVARELGVSPQQVVLAWELAKSERLIPIPGASRPESITDSARAVDLELSEEQIARLDG